MEVPLATMKYVIVPHRPYVASDCDNSIERLIMSAAGDAATTAFLNWTGTDHGDNAISQKRLRGLGAGFFLRRRLMREARQAGNRKVWELKDGIFAVAAALREHRVLSQYQIDAAIKARV
jgi:hypothetical protein